MNFKSVLQNVVLLLASVAIGYIALEAGYRFYLYRHYSNFLIETLYRLGRETARPAQWIKTFDPDVGFRYVPNRIWNHSPHLQNHWRTNEYGLIANDIDRSAYSIEKPAGEFRIAVLGDSFAAGNAVYIRWPDLLQDYLNRSPAWRAFVHNKFTRVLNFGLDGTGLVQWGPVYQYRAEPFAPDLVIVSYFIDDVLRQFVYVGNSMFASDAELRGHIENNVRRAMAQLPWFTIYPELLAATLGPYLHLTRHLMPTTSIMSPRFESQEAGIRASISSLEKVRCLNPRMLLVRQPALEEFQFLRDDETRWPSTPDLIGLETKFSAAAEAAGFKIVDLVATEPPAKDLEQVYALYNMPLDTHMSDYGVLVYAGWMFRYLSRWIETPAASAAAAPACS